jgi:hypothetical protein
MDRSTEEWNMKIFTRDDLAILMFAFLASLLGFASVFADMSALAWVSIAAADLYLLSVLIIAAMLSDDDEFAKRHKWARILPHRRATGLLIVVSMMLAIISGFAGLYVGTKVFHDSKTSLDALYISFFTMGFTDFSPTPGYGQLVVIAQLASGVLLLVGAFPLLLSRISTFMRL